MELITVVPSKVNVTDPSIANTVGSYCSDQVPSSLFTSIFSHPLSPATSSAAQINVLSIFIIVFFLVNVQKYEILPVKFHYFSLRQAEPSQAPLGIRKKVFMFNRAYEAYSFFSASAGFILAVLR